MDEDYAKKVEDDINQLTKDMAELTATRQKILARGHGDETPQGGDLRRQVDEWKALMEKEREEFAARRLEHDKKLERLIELAEQQQPIVKTKNPEDKETVSDLTTPAKAPTTASMATPTKAAAPQNLPRTRGTQVGCLPGVKAEWRQAEQVPHRRTP